MSAWNFTAECKPPPCEYVLCRGHGVFVVLMMTPSGEWFDRGYRHYTVPHEWMEIPR